MTSCRYTEAVREATAALEGGEFVRAEQLFQLLCDTAPGRPAGFAGLARVAQARSDWPLACTRWQVCLDRFSEHAPTSWTLALAWALLHAGRHADAAAAFLRLSDTAPDDVKPLTGLAYAVTRDRRWPDAIPLWNRLIHDFPAEVRPDWYLQLGSCLENSGQMEAACATYAAMVARCPDHARAWHSLIWLLLRHRGQDAADAASREALRHLTNHPLLLMQSAWLALKRDDAGAAQHALRTAVNVAASTALLEAAFELIPSAFVGWTRTRLWLDIEARLNIIGGNEARSTGLRMRLKLALRDHDGVIALHDGAGPGANDIWMRRFAGLMPALRAWRTPDLGAEKIFCIGLSRTGTTSVMRALEILGFQAAHNINHFTCEMLRLEDAFLFDALGDIPVSAIFETLYHMFPNAKFIYTHRPLGSWIESIRKHRARRFRAGASGGQASGAGPSPLTAARGPGEPPFGPQYALVHEALWSRFPDRPAGRAAFEQRVRAFFTANDGARLLELDVFSGDGWTRLCSFVDRSVPDAPFPFENQS